MRNFKRGLCKWEREHQVRVRKIKLQHTKLVEDVEGILIIEERDIVLIVDLEGQQN